MSRKKASLYFTGPKNTPPRVYFKKPPGSNIKVNASQKTMCAFLLLDKEYSNRAKKITGMIIL
ncbi:MAG: hypothetical protein EPN88_09355 [Bacteroidetes bacterium]|nr:MAG: hypothetical protein EPN88_09355 [Bacteroidota bacterium]